MVMTIIAMVIGNINNASAFVPRCDRKKPILSLPLLLPPRPRQIAAFPAIESINDTCFPAYSCVRIWQLDG